MSNHAARPSPTSGLGPFGSGAAERLAAKTTAMAAATSFVRIVLPSTITELYRKVVDTGTAKSDLPLRQELEQVAGLALEHTADGFERRKADGPPLAGLEDRQVGEGDVDLL